MFSRKTLCVTDFGAETVIAVCAEKKADGSFHLLGGGEVAADGVERGRIVHLGDAVECVHEAIRKAEKSSGVKFRAVYYNLDDPGMESVRAQGSQSISGEGEIRRSDVRRARHTALRLAAHFDKSVVYARETGFLIDDRDLVASPVGVFGRKLGVSMHLLVAGAEHFGMWQKLFYRCQVPHAIPVVSAWSTAYGILPKEDRRKRSLIFDWGKDFLNGILFEDGAIRDHALWLTDENAPSRIKAFWEKNGSPAEILVTGDLAADKNLADLIQPAIPVPARVALPLGPAKLGEAKYASLAGLLHVADELEKQRPRTSRGRHAFASVQERVTAFMQEYF
ncbi:MAG: hypothetical protein HYZ52_03190 [Candidatus Omnitrophica bacterium]|nr:hypothetical protein [Candidatus Omnitrophota bacterium]